MIRALAVHPEPGEETRTPLDPAALERLRRQGGESLLTELLRSFRERTPARLRDARAAVDAGRPQDAVRVFHTLKSSAALLGAHAIEAEARRAELEGEHGRLDGMLASAGRIEALFAELLPELGGGRVPAAARRYRIALVEDNEDNRLLLRVILRRRYDVDEYADGREALEGVQATRPDLVLLDVSLPGMDGIDVLRELRETPAVAGVPAIAITAHAMASDRERLLAAGFDDYVSKPILDQDDLERRIRRLLERGR